ncbi:ABC transporter substrate-binding protein [Arthrobacter sp. B2a2-09]|uniref:ABC transporter substrate-binding protein n=1 Tax=Arthrobacter sp. B2a2-09 TaxID=2952822 RepID=UPI0022CD81D8|nr:ABC transporter substrate-binding protein [Arthrobacter sp. B2a2-09]MCZ9880458.1 ABC transporter substrate-binding protein [Arthrobacter sp. B2a2-09]
MSSSKVKHFTGYRTRLGVVLVSALLLAGCSGGSSASDPNGSPADTLVVATSAAPQVLVISGGWDVSLQNAVMDTVLGRDSDGKLIPRLAESWSEPTPNTLVFKLRQGVVFSDGTPMTAEDVAFSLQRHTDPKVASQVASIVATVQSVKATGPDEVTVVLSKGAQTFLANVPVVWQVLPKKLAEAHPQDLGTPEVPPIGTGPYKITHFSLVDGVTLERNDKYWGTKAPIAKVKTTTITSPDALRLAATSGDVDYAPVLATDFQNWESVTNFNLQKIHSIGIESLWMNVTDPHLSDLHVRRAIAHAVDREAALRLSTDGHGQLADTIVPLPQLTNLYGDGYQQVVDGLPHYDYNLEAAKAELAKSKFPNGFDITVNHDAADPLINALQAIKADLAKIGINITLNPLPADKFWAGRMRHEDLTLGLSSLGYVTADVGEVLPDQLGSVAAQPQGFNFSQFANPAMDAKIDDVLGTTGEARKAATTSVMETAADQVPYIPIAYPDYAYAVSKKFIGTQNVWTLDPFTTLRPAGS